MKKNHTIDSSLANFGLGFSFSDDRIGLGRWQGVKEGNLFQTNLTSQKGSQGLWVEAIQIIQTSK
jgi:hypothetical protein